MAHAMNLKLLFKNAHSQDLEMADQGLPPPGLPCLFDNQHLEAIHSYQNYTSYPLGLEQEARDIIGSMDRRKPGHLTQWKDPRPPSQGRGTMVMVIATPMVTVMMMVM